MTYKQTLPLFSSSDIQAFIVGVVSSIAATMLIKSMYELFTRLNEDSYNGKTLSIKGTWVTVFFVHGIKCIEFYSFNQTKNKIRFRGQHFNSKDNYQKIKGIGFCHFDQLSLCYYQAEKNSVVNGVILSKIRNVGRDQIIQGKYMDYRGELLRQSTKDEFSLVRLKLSLILKFRLWKGVPVFNNYSEAFDYFQNIRPSYLKYFPLYNKKISLLSKGL